MGSKITFETYEINGKIILSQETAVVGVWPIAAMGVNIFNQAKGTWKDQADNHSGKMNK